MAVQKTHGKDLINICEVGPGRGWRQNWCQWEGRNFSIRRLGKPIIGILWRQNNIRLRFEVANIEGRGAYWRSWFECGADLIPPAWHRGYRGQYPVRGEPIIAKGESKKEYGRGISGVYWRQGYPIWKGLFYKYVPSRVDVPSSRYTGDDGGGETNICPGIKRR